METQNDRMNNLRDQLREQEIEALLITLPANWSYISGFTGSNGALLITQEYAYIFTDFRYRIQVSRQAPHFTLSEISGKRPLHQALAEVAAELKLQHIWFEAHHITVEQREKMEKTWQEEQFAATAPNLHAASRIVETLREVKEPNELQLLRQAIAITDSAMEAVRPCLRPDHTERQAAWMIEIALHDHGAHGVAFPIIVAAGSHAAMPHAQPSDELLGSGCPIIIDMGATYQGYHGDLTRTIVLGEPDERFWNVYHLVLLAQSQAIANIRAGMTGAEADDIVRSQFASAGFGEQFGHGLGHGVGLEIHESPRLGLASEQILRCGEVFSIEPGLYIEGWGGVRIEDLVLLREHGCEVLSGASKDPVNLLVQ